MLVDISCVTYLGYRLILLAKGSRAMQVLWGLLVFFLLVYLSGKLGLTTMHWILRQMLLLGPVVLVLLFYPELRHLLEEFGRLGFWRAGVSPVPKEGLHPLVNEVVKAVMEMARKKIGALMVFEPYPQLDHYLSPGIPLDARVTNKLIVSLFYPGNPLHDGAAVICGDRLIAAGCTLPFTENPMIDQSVHMRHKAAIGVSERGAIALVVSEETGIISIAFNGRLQRGFREDTLRDRLLELLGPPPSPRRFGDLGSSFIGKRLHIPTIKSSQSAQNKSDQGSGS